MNEDCVCESCGQVIEQDSVAWKHMAPDIAKIAHQLAKADRADLLGHLFRESQRCRTLLRESRQLDGSPFKK